MSSIGDEIRRRFPRLGMSLIMATVFWIISIFIPPLFRGIVVPVLSVDAAFPIWAVTVFVALLFLIRALSDALVLGDVAVDVMVRRLGIKEKVSPKRAVRDFIYIIALILVAAAISPILAGLGEIGALLSKIVTFALLGVIIVLIYDIGRVLYRVVEKKMESLADRLAAVAEGNRDGK